MGIVNKSIVNKSIVASENFDTYMGGMNRLAVHVVASDVTEAKDIDAAFGVDIDNDILTSSNHGYVDNTVVQLTSTGTLPAGLAAVTDYHVISATTDTFQLSASQGGVAINITDVGTAAKEITQIICTNDDSVKEITQIICTAEDANTTLNSKYFILQDDVGSVAVWYNVDAGGEEPSHGADRALEVALSASDLIGAVGTATYDVIIADSKFAASNDDLGGTIKVLSSTYGVKAAAEDGDSGFTTSEDTAGVDSDLDGKYFILQDEVGSVAFWMNVAGASEPSHGADRSVEIDSISPADVIGTVGTAVYDAIIADSKFALSADDTAGTIKVESSTYGVKVAAEDGDSGFTTSEDTAGSTSTHTATPKAVSGASVTVQKSCDGVNWVDVASATSITGDATFMIEDADVAYTYIRSAFAISAGFMKLKIVMTGWSDA